MLVRLRWFMLGALGSLGLTAYLAAQVRRARERLSPRTLAQAGGRAAAGALHGAARRISPAERS